MKIGDALIACQDQHGQGDRDTGSDRDEGERPHDGRPQIELREESPQFVSSALALIGHRLRSNRFAEVAPQPGEIQDPPL